MEKTPQFSIQVFGDYTLLDRIAVGGMAEIFKARQEGPRGFERILVIKRILQHLSEDQEFKQMFDDEAKIAAQLRHANIVQIFELGDVEGTPYIAMEYVEGKNLRDLTRALQSKGLQLTVEQTLFIMSETLRGLHFAHQRMDSNNKPLEIIHRDMSPQNIILSYEGEVKILDFGIAKAASRISKTEVGVLKGKFSYMAPEQASGRQVTQSTDIYACGVIFHELLTGERLFRADTDVETIERVKMGVVLKPSEKNSQVSAALDAIVLKSLQRNVEKRYASAGDMHADLARLMREQGVQYGAQELSAFMKTLFAEFIVEERERLKKSLEQSPDRQMSSRIRTHIAYKADAQPLRSPPAQVVNSRSQNSRSLFVLLLVLFFVSLGIYVYAQLSGPEFHIRFLERALEKKNETLPLSRPEPIKLPPFPENLDIPDQTSTAPGKEKMEDVLKVEKTPEIIEPKPEDPRTKENTKEAPLPRQRPSRIPLKMGSGTLDVLPPPEGYAKLFIDNEAYGFVPGTRAVGIKLQAGKHKIRCESGSRTYTGTITIVADSNTRISCGQLR